MAITIKEHDLKEEFKSTYNYWKDFQEFVTFFINSLIERGEYIYYEFEDGKGKEFEAVNHFPDLKMYEVWSEGYRATGETGKAYKLGSALARNFAEACHKVMATLYLKGIKEYETDEKKQHSLGRWDYDPSDLTYWGCTLFDNEIDARRSFG